MSDVTPAAPRRRWISWSIAALVGAFCLYYLVALFPWRDALPVLAGIDLGRLAFGGGAAILVVWALRTWRFITIARAHGAPLPAREAYFYIVAALGLAAVTPLQVGEAFKLQLIRRTHGLSALMLGKLFVGERLVDVGVLAIMTALALGLTQALPAPFSLLAVIGASGASLALLALAMWGKGAPSWSTYFFVGARDARDRLAIIGATTGCWVATSALWWACISAIDVELSALAATATMGAVTFANVTSAIPGGLGVSEVGVALMLMHYGVTPAVAHAAALAIRLSTLLILALSLPQVAFWRISSKTTGR